MDDLNAMQARMDALVREQSDRRTLTEQRGEEIKASAHEFMTKQAKAAERYVMHRRELGKRQDEKGRPKPQGVSEFDFEPEGHQAENGSQGIEDIVPTGPRTGGRHAEPVPPTPPAPTPAPPPPPLPPVPSARPAPGNRRRMSTEEIDDEDDAFLNNRWRG
ncbi:hypothetical protein [Amycolatopsis saalfeldensis]|uniref:Uncharacterized protein n=1 Tax=Amycolatopsis saalfeldensis TaxID=394193 RepID=A0A1H8WPT8_9PSEU|nr:hypothetical protein [Amycolatopsis saalfeldensis]SEP29636.1 hypothetical protein SAMN04489732_105395 [Amycolatopsis saalfeldensis]